MFYYNNKKTSIMAFFISMKFYLTFITLFLISLNVMSKEVTIDIFFVADAVDNRVMEFGDMLTYRQTEGTATWNDSEGDYGLLKCMGNYVTTKSKGTVLNNYCQGTNRDKESFWLIMNRSSADYELGVGRINYLKGEGKFKEYENLECMYAVELIEGLAVIKQKCNFKEN